MTAISYLRQQQTSHDTRNTPQVWANCGSNQLLEATTNLTRHTTHATRHRYGPTATAISHLRQQQTSHDTRNTPQVWATCDSNQLLEATTNLTRHTTHATRNRYGPTVTAISHLRQQQTSHDTCNTPQVWANCDSKGLKPN